MGLRIRTNISALNAQRNLSNVNENLSTHMSRLSSGLRINKAADDAAGLGISEKMRSKVAALGQAKRNGAGLGPPAPPNEKRRGPRASQPRQKGNGAGQRPAPLLWGTVLRGQ